MWLPAICSGCGSAFEVDPAADEVTCGDCDSPVYLVSVEDLAETADVDGFDAEAAELEAIVEAESALGLMLAAFDTAGLAGLSDAVALLDEAAARGCLLVAAVQLAETDALADLAGMN